ncbi:MAG: CopG family transcriptional regulator [Clostridiales bacterium]|nr:CopG family transcriptional regulator [Clostridiales bacterium]
MADFIPKTYKKDPITIRIDFKMLEQIDKMAAKYNLSRSAFINQCIAYALEHMPENENNTAES